MKLSYKKRPTLSQTSTSCSLYRSWRLPIHVCTRLAPQRRMRQRPNELDGSARACSTWLSVSLSLCLSLTLRLSASFSVSARLFRSPPPSLAPTVACLYCALRSRESRTPLCLVYKFLRVAWLLCNGVERVLCRLPLGRWHLKSTSRAHVPSTQKQTAQMHPISTETYVGTRVAYVLKSYNPLWQKNWLSNSSSAFASVRVFVFARVLATSSRQRRGKAQNYSPNSGTTLTKIDGRRKRKCTFVSMCRQSAHICNQLLRVRNTATMITSGFIMSGV